MWVCSRCTCVIIVKHEKYPKHDSRSTVTYMYRGATINKSVGSFTIYVTWSIINDEIWVNVLTARLQTRHCSCLVAAAARAPMSSSSPRDRGVNDRLLHRNRVAVGRLVGRKR